MRWTAEDTRALRNIVITWVVVAFGTYGLLTWRGVG